MSVEIIKQFQNFTGRDGGGGVRHLALILLELFMRFKNIPANVPTHMVPFTRL